MGIEDDVKIRILCQNLVLIKEVGLRWLIGSPFLPPVTVVSTLRCLHTQASDSISPNLPMELDEVGGLLPRGLEVIGAVIAHDRDNLKKEKVASLAISAVRNFRKILYQDDHEDRVLIGAVLDLNKADVDRDLKFYVSRTRESDNLGKLCTVVYIDQPEKEIWKNGCLVCCEIPLKMPLYYTSNNPKDLEDAYGQAIENVRQKLTVPQIAYIIEVQNKSPDGPGPIVLHGMELDLPSELPENAFSYDTSQESFGKSLTCSYFFPGINDAESFASVEKDTDIIRVSIMLNRSKSNIEPVAPLAEYYPANGEAKLMVLIHKLEVVSYAAKDLQLTHVVSKLIIPAIIDQLYSMKNKILPDILKQHPLLQPYHFVPPGFLHPITVIYDLSYGETEMKQVEIRKSLHLRLGLPFDRPLLRVANGINLSRVMDNTVEKSELKGSFLLRDVHHSIPRSGVSGGNASLIQGSYEYYHYMQDGFDDSGWGCAYRSLQSIISWFRLQHYTSVDVPSHREIQQSLVDIGDKDPSFVGSREWIGAIELSFVLDKLLGVSCKIINVRSGIELPEKCRELALHFETQGTPVMIGGGVLAYTLLGVDYDELSGDCGFLILDPHYTGNEDLKKIVNGGWCAWKKAVDSKGKHFFLPDKFYNLLLPQRPNIV